MQAIGLGCPGGEDQTIPLGEWEFAAVDTASWRVAKYLGYAAGPNHGGKLWAAREGQVIAGNPDIPPNTSAAILVLTTGVLPPLDGQGGLIVAAPQLSAGENQNPNGGVFPAPISPLRGSNFGAGGSPFVDCDLINDCSDSLYGQWFDQGWNILADKLWMRFELLPPEGVHGYVFDFAFFSSEYPTFIDTQFNDMFVAWSVSDSYAGNLTFVGQAPLSTTSLSEIDGFAHVGEDPALLGTGFENHAGTAWLRARGPAAPGEPLELTFMVSDLGDAIGGSVVLLDNFRWSCEGCEGPDCGFAP